MADIDGVDFGGPDGHIAEGETHRVTRCSTSVSAITAYFCGADIAKNQDAALGESGKPPNFGTKSFRQYLSTGCTS